MAIHLSLMCTVIHLKLNTAVFSHIGHVQLTHEESTSEEFEVYVGGGRGGAGGGTITASGSLSMENFLLFCQGRDLEK